mmetsp:Transcript_7752/g.22871  ORF Transcript_7752/g.22871 Transcript_7752/m.22871 type:complete len:327 (+) Transcript_7752:1092-2072(+)
MRPVALAAGGGPSAGHALPHAERTENAQLGSARARSAAAAGSATPTHGAGGGALDPCVWRRGYRGLERGGGGGRSDRRPPRQPRGGTRSIEWPMRAPPSTRRRTAARRPRRRRALPRLVRSHPVRHHGRGIQSWAHDWPRVEETGRRRGLHPHGPRRGPPHQRGGCGRARKRDDHGGRWERGPRVSEERWQGESTAALPGPCLQPRPAAWAGACGALRTTASGAQESVRTVSPRKGCMRGQLALQALCAAQDGVLLPGQGQAPARVGGDARAGSARAQAAHGPHSGPATAGPPQLLCSCLPGAAARALPGCHASCSIRVPAPGAFQ